jgi:hypothetical protein
MFLVMVVSNNNIGTGSGTGPGSLFLTPTELQTIGRGLTRIHANQKQKILRKRLNHIRVYRRSSAARFLFRTNWFGLLIRRPPIYRVATARVSDFVCPNAAHYSEACYTTVDGDSDSPTQRFREN